MTAAVGAAPGRVRPGTPALDADALRRWWPRLQVLAGVAVLVVLVARVGAGALVEGLRAVDAAAVLAALAIGLVTTLLSAGRWVLVARGLGVPLRPGRAVADTYRAQFLNSVLPAGVLGDVDRAVSHGLADGGPAARAVVLERVAGQTVVVGVGVTALAASGAAAAGLLVGPVPAAVAAGAAVAGAVLAVAARRSPRLRGGLARALSDVRAGLGGRTGPGVVLLSVAGLAGHLALFVVAARAAGAQAPLADLLPLLLAALLAMVLPLNVGGWGPREAVAAVGFSAAGYGAAQGLAVAVAFGVLGLVACLPGALVPLLLRRRGGASPAPVPSVPAQADGQGVVRC